jgi:hypothetical protein
VPGGVAEDDALPLQGPEQTTQSDGDLSAGVSGQILDGGLDLLPGDPAVWSRRPPSTR